MNHYGTSYATGKKLDKSTAALFEVGFGGYERVYEKDGKVIGNKGQNGHPYDGESPAPRCSLEGIAKLRYSPVGI